jgi:hypothetical protein
MLTSKIKVKKKLNSTRTDRTFRREFHLLRGMEKTRNFVKVSHKTEGFLFCFAEMSGIRSRVVSVITTSRNYA